MLIPGTNTHMVVSRHGATSTAKMFRNVSRNVERARCQTPVQNFLRSAYRPVVCNSKHCVVCETTNKNHVVCVFGRKWKCTWRNVWWARMKIYIIPKELLESLPFGVWDLVKGHWKIKTFKNKTNTHRWHAMTHQRRVSSYAILSTRNSHYFALQIQMLNSTLYNSWRQNANSSPMMVCPSMSLSFHLVGMGVIYPKRSTVFLYAAVCAVMQPWIYFAVFWNA